MRSAGIVKFTGNVQTFEPVRIIAGLQIVLHYEGLLKSFVNILLNSKKYFMVKKENIS